MLPADAEFVSAILQLAPVISVVKALNVNSAVGSPLASIVTTVLAAMFSVPSAVQYTPG